MHKIDSPNIRFTAIDYMRRLFMGKRLSHMEADIVALLFANQGSVVSIEEISEVLWPDVEDMPDFYGGTIEAHVSHIRKKLGKNIIKKHRLLGYELTG